MIESNWWIETETYFAGTNWFAVEWCHPHAIGPVTRFSLS